jgi:hypothetical protein
MLKVACPGPNLAAHRHRPRAYFLFATRGEGRDDGDESLLVELARLEPSLHASVPNNLPRPFSRFVRGGVRVGVAGPVAD